MRNPKLYKPFFNQSGMSIAMSLVGTAFVGVLVLLVGNSLNRSQSLEARTSQVREIDHIASRIKVFLSAEPVCTQMLGGIDPNNDTQWKSLPRSLPNPADPNSFLLLEGETYGNQFTLDRIAIDNFVPFAQGNPLLGEADFVMAFSTSGIMSATFVRRLRLTVNLLDMVASDGRAYRGINGCMYQSVLPSCMDNDILVFKSGKLRCGSVLRLATLSNQKQEHFPMESGDSPAPLMGSVRYPNALGNDIVTAFVSGTQMLTTVDRYNSASGGVALLNISYTPKMDGRMRFVANIPWRAYNDEPTDGNAIYGVIYVTDPINGTKHIAGQGLIGRPFKRGGPIDWDASIGGTGTIHGEYPARAGLTYPIEIRAMKFKNSAPNGRVQIGALHFLDHAVDGSLEVFEVAGKADQP